MALPRVALFASFSLILLESGTSLAEEAPASRAVDLAQAAPPATATATATAAGQGASSDDATSPPAGPPPKREPILTLKGEPVSIASRGQPADALREAVATIRPLFTVCVKKHGVPDVLARTTLRLQWYVDEEGRPSRMSARPAAPATLVGQPSDATNDSKLAALEACLLAAAESLNLPVARAGGERITVDYAVGKFVYQGGLSREQIQRVISSRVVDIKRCYEYFLKFAPPATGKLVLYWVISPAGDVRKVSVLEDTLEQPATRACVVRLLKTLRFPPPGGGGIVNVTYPFVFSTG